MRLLALIFISVCAIAATVPDRYLVQLAGEPAAAQAVRRGHRPHTSDQEFRARVITLRQQHLQMRAALDTDGHGTGTSTIVAGAAIADPIGPISGIAPKAFLGNYKVFPDNSGSGAQEDWIISAIDDAVADGMDVINLSLGSLLASRP